jgi:transposase
VHWLAGREWSVPKAYPKQFRRDIVAVARRGEITLSKVAQHFGISESCLHRWMKDADVEEGVRDGMTAAERNELREPRKRIKILKQQNCTLLRAPIEYETIFNVETVA